MPRPSFEEGGRYRAIKTAAGMLPFSGPPTGGITPAQILTRVGAIMKARQTKAFHDQRRGNTAWPERAVPNIPGILADLSVGRRPPARRWEPRKAGIDTGALWKSIDFRVLGRDEVEIGSVLPYAGKIHAGGPSESVTITETVRQNLYRYLYGSKSKGIRYSKKVKNPEPGEASMAGFDVVRATAKRRLGFLFNAKFAGKRLKFNLPARPFATLEDDDVEAILELVGVEVSRAR